MIAPVNRPNRKTLLKHRNRKVAQPEKRKEEPIFLGYDSTDMTPILVPRKDLTQGTLFLGRPGSGKSKLIQSVIRQMMASQMPFIVVDAEGDLSEDLVLDVAAFVCDEKCEAILERTHFLRPDWQSSFQIDPFESPTFSTKLQADAWLGRQVSLMSNAFVRSVNATSLEETPRLKRWLENVLTAIGTCVGPDQKRMPLANIFTLLDVNHPKFDVVYGIIRPNLPEPVRQDFDVLIDLRNRPQDVLGQIESTVNRVRSLMQPLVAAAFRRIGSNKAPGATINFLRLIQKRSIVLINLKDTMYLSPEQADSLGKIMIYLVVTAMQSVADKSERIQCGLIVDEFQRFVTEDILRGLCQGRKWGLSVFLITQTLNYINLVQEGFADIILSVVATIVCFQQRHPVDLETLTRYLYQGNLNHTEMVNEVDRHRGYAWHNVTEHSESCSETSSWGESFSNSFGTTNGAGHSSTDSWGIVDAIATMLSWNSSHSSGKSESSGTSVSDGAGSSAGNGFMESPILDGRHVVGTTLSGSRNNSTSSFHGSGYSQNSGLSEAETKGQGRGESRAQSQIRGGAASSSRSQSNSVTNTTGTSRGGAVSRGRNTSYKKVPLAIIEAELQPQGKPKYDYNFQLEQYKSHIYSLPQRFAVIARAGQRTVTVETPFVEDPFPSLELRSYLIRAIEQKLRSIHSYYATPSDLTLENEKSVDQFIGLNLSAPAHQSTGNGSTKTFN